MTPPTAAFDIYGTLANTAAIAPTLAEYGIPAAAAFAARWRDKQLEYSFRRALMAQYTPFSECTKTALDFVLREQNITLADSARTALMEKYAVLPAFADAAPALQNLAAADIRIFAFSNGETAAVQKILQHNNLAQHFNQIVSVEDARSFKPDPKVYAHFLQRADSSPANTWLISGNPFDIIGARAAGWRAVWLNRNNRTFDPWPDFAPSAIISSLSELPPLFAAANK